MHDLLAILYAASVSVRDGETNEAEVSTEFADEYGRVWSTTVTVRRYDAERTDDDVWTNLSQQLEGGAW